MEERLHTETPGIDPTDRLVNKQTRSELPILDGTGEASNRLLKICFAGISAACCLPGQSMFEMNCSFFSGAAAS
jgi:hypothetical protein